MQLAYSNFSPPAKDKLSSIVQAGLLPERPNASIACVNLTRTPLKKQKFQSSHKESKSKWTIASLGRYWSVKSAGEVQGSSDEWVAM